MVLSSVFFTPLCSSVNKGSTRVWSLISFWSALAAHMRTSRLGSFSALMKVVWSCGRKGFNMAPTCYTRENVTMRRKTTVTTNEKECIQTLPNKSPRVCSTATLTFHVKRSPRIRIKGPVMFTTKGLRAAALVRLITSPSPLAACSFNSGVPLRIPSLNIGRIGAIPWR